MYYKNESNKIMRFSLPVVIVIISLVLFASHFSPVYADTYNYVNQIDGSKGSPPLQMDVPQGVSVDSSGNIYVVDTGDSRVIKFNPDGTVASIISNFNGNDVFNFPLKVAITSSGFYVTDPNNKIGRAH